MRWDEWIDSDSARLAVFRTYTVQNPKSNYLSPFPNIMPDSSQSLMTTHSLTKTIDEACDLANKTTSLLDVFKRDREASNQKLLLEEERIKLAT